MRALIYIVSVAGAALLTAGAVQAQSDRYGPDRTADQRVATLGGSYLNWPGKQAPESDVGAAAPAEQPAPPPPPATEDNAPAVASLPAVLPAPPPETPPPAPQPIAVAQPAPVPAAQTAPAAATAQAAQPGQRAPQQTAEDAGHGRLPPHIYSVARQYGLTPDPIPLPTQFFADQSDTDLASPPPPLPPRPVPGAPTVNNPSSINTPSNRARAVAEDTPDPDAGDDQQ
jgi:hypothetical protein